MGRGQKRLTYGRYLQERHPELRYCPPEALEARFLGMRSAHRRLFFRSLKEFARDPYSPYAQKHQEMIRKAAARFNDSEVQELANAFRSLALADVHAAARIAKDFGDKAAGFVRTVYLGLHEAAEDGDTSRMEALIRQGAHLEYPDENGRTALIRAASAGKTRSIGFLIGYDASLDARDNDGATALMAAAKSGHYEAAQYLMDAGVDHAIKDHFGKDARAWAEKNGHAGIANMIKGKEDEAALLNELRECAAGGVFSAWPGESIKSLPQLKDRLAPERWIRTDEPRFYGTTEVYCGGRAKPSAIEYSNRMKRGDVPMFLNVPVGDMREGEIASVLIKNYKASAVFCFRCMSKNTHAGGSAYQIMFEFVMPIELGRRFADEISRGNTSIIQKAYDALFPVNSRFNDISVANEVRMVGTVGKPAEKKEQESRPEPTSAEPIPEPTVPEPEIPEEKETEPEPESLEPKAPEPEVPEEKETEPEPKPPEPTVPEPEIPEEKETEPEPEPPDPRALDQTIQQDVSGEIISMDQKNLDALLLKAVCDGDLAKVREMRQKGANIDARRDDRSTPLILSLYLRKHDIASYLIEEKADVNAKDNVGWTPLLNAIDNNLTDLALRLIKEGASINALTKEGKTPLSLARERKNKELVLRLEELGAKEPPKPPLPAHEQERLDNKLMQAVLSGVLDVAKECIEEDANVNMKFNDGSGLLVRAIERGHYNVADLLIDQEIDLEAANEFGQTPLIMSLYHFQPGLARRLVEAGADVNAKDKSGATVLMYSLEYATPEMSDYLIQNGAKGMLQKARLFWRKTRRKRRLLALLGAVSAAAYYSNDIENFIIKTVQEKPAPRQEDKSWLVSIKIENARKALLQEKREHVQHGMDILKELRPEFASRLLEKMLTDNDLKTRKKAVFAAWRLVKQSKDPAEFYTLLGPLQKINTRYARATSARIKRAIKKKGKTWLRIHQ